MGENTRKDDFVFNTEYKKCPASNCTSDETVDEAVPEATLFHLLLQEKVLFFYCTWLAQNLHVLYTLLTYPVVFFSHNYTSHIALPFFFLWEYIKLFEVISFFMSIFFLIDRL